MTTMVGNANGYTCEDVEGLLDDFLDGELAPWQKEKIEEHLAECGSCAGGQSFEAEVLVQLKDRLRATKAPAELVDKVERVMREVKEGEEAPGDA
jgi:anti-sigma factor (TIGR02949 family)